VTRANGELHEAIEYFPFGETWMHQGGNTEKSPYLFTSKELDEETGLYYFGARYYDPRTSVWVSADRILGDYLDSDRGLGGIYNPTNLALYAYAHHNPVKLNDPDGNAAWCAGGLVIPGVGWVGSAACVAITGALAGATVYTGAKAVSDTNRILSERSASSPAQAAPAAPIPPDDPDDRPNSGPVKKNEVTTYESFVERSAVGDGLEGHEIWQHANLNQNGLAATRLSTPASKGNPVIALDKATHVKVNAAQRLLDPRNMTPRENIAANAKILRDLRAAPRNVVDKAEKAALEHAKSLGH
jgi:RHS repeat-associated protein